MEDTRITWLALGLLAVALSIIVGSLLLAPALTALLATLGAWLNLAGLVGITLKR